MESASVTGLWWKWLVVMCAGSALFGLGLAVMPEVFLTPFSVLFFGAPDAHLAFGEPSVRYLIFVYGVLGAVMAGWMVLLLAVVLGPFRRGEIWAWNAVAGSLIIWFVADSSHSLAAGFWQNAALNLVFLIGFAVPLAATYRLFHRS